MVDLDAPDPFSLAAWRANLIAEDPVKTIWLMCSIASLIYGWHYFELLERSATLKPIPRA